MGDYGRHILELAGRIYEQIPKHPEIMETDDVFRLQRVPGLELGDKMIGPTLMQVRYALATARHRYREQHPDWRP